MEKKKLSSVIKENLQKISILLISFVYIVQGVFTIKQRNTTILEIIGGVILSVIIGVLISNNMTSMGVRDGRRSEKFLDSEKCYGETKERATPYFDKLFAWCEFKNDQELNLKKKEIIQNAGLSWKAYRIGYYKEHTEGLKENQIKAIDEANNCKIEKINNRILLSDVSNNMDDLLFGKKQRKFGLSEREYRAKASVSDIFAKFFIGLVSGLYMLAPLINGENWKDIVAHILWNTLHIVIWLAVGIIKYSNAKAFMEDEYRQTHIIQKTEYLNEFIVTMQNSPQVVEEYRENEDDIDNYIAELIKEKEKNDKERILD